MICSIIAAAQRSDPAKTATDRHNPSFHLVFLWTAPRSHAQADARLIENEDCPVFAFLVIAC